MCIHIRINKKGHDALFVIVSIVRFYCIGDIALREAMLIIEKDYFLPSDFIQLSGFFSIDLIAPSFEGLTTGDIFAG